MTLREVRERLGFKPPNIFRKEQKKKIAELAADPRYSRETAAELRKRQMGRTTEMLLRAVHAASKGNKVFITGRNNRVFRDMARDWCHRLGIDPKLIVNKVPEYQYPPCLVFTDHTCRCLP
jgi:hypothetical protein